MPLFAFIDLIYFNMHPSLTTHGRQGLPGAGGHRIRHHALLDTLYYRWSQGRTQGGGAHGPVPPPPYEV